MPWPRRQPGDLHQVRGERLLEAGRGGWPATPAAISQSHGDWTALDQEADRITADAARIAASLQNELQQAAAGLAAISTAAAAVRACAAWSGSYGVSIQGSPGADTLAKAWESLHRGDYTQATQSALAANRAASGAVSAADVRVAQLRREEEERQARERRRREEEDAARRRSYSSSSSSSSWGSSSRSSFSSGSGSSRSSFSSGSGVSRSGW